MPQRGKDDDGGLSRFGGHAVRRALDVPGKDKPGRDPESRGQRAVFGAAFPEQSGDHHRSHGGETRESESDRQFENAFGGPEGNPIREEGYSNDEPARKKDAALFAIFFFSAVVSKNVFGKHRADGQHLVGIGAHDRGDDSGAQDSST